MIFDATVASKGNKMSTCSTLTWEWIVFKRLLNINSFCRLSCAFWCVSVFLILMTIYRVTFVPVCECVEMNCCLSAQSESVNILETRFNETTLVSIYLATTKFKHSFFLFIVVHFIVQWTRKAEQRMEGKKVFTYYFVGTVGLFIFIWTFECERRRRRRRREKKIMKTSAKRPHAFLLSFCFFSGSIVE